LSKAFDVARSIVNDDISLQIITICSRRISSTQEIVDAVRQYFGERKVPLSEGAVRVTVATRLSTLESLGAISYVERGWQVNKDVSGYLEKYFGITIRLGY
jgi:hypothetical protein